MSSTVLTAEQIKAKGITTAEQALSVFLVAKLNGNTAAARQALALIALLP